MRASILIEVGFIPDKNGIVKVIWERREPKNHYRYYVSKYPIWDILGANKTYLLLVGEEINIKRKKLKKCFKRINKEL